MQFDRGYISPYFVTDTDNMEAILEDAYILIHDKKISAMRDLLPVLEKTAQTGKPLLIIAEDIEGEALATLVVSLALFRARRWWQGSPTPHLRPRQRPRWCPPCCRCPRL